MLPYECNIFKQEINKRKTTNQVINTPLYSLYDPYCLCCQMTNIRLLIINFYLLGLIGNCFYINCVLKNIRTETINVQENGGKGP